MQFWDFAALTYYRVLDRFTGTLNALVIDKLQLKPGEAVLDIGCGTGALIPALAEAVGPQGRVVAMDFSPRMVAMARKRAAKWPNVGVRQADACDTDHGAGEFDAAVALGAFSAMPDVPAAIANAADALKPGGRCSCSTCGWPRRPAPRGSCGPLTGASRGSAGPMSSTSSGRCSSGWSRCSGSKVRPRPW